MRLDASMSQRMDQKMILAPRMIQSMEILQLPIMALQERIEAELQENPVLEMRDSNRKEGDEEFEAPAPTNERDVDDPTRDLVIDDTPEAVVVSCFNPVRREVGRITLERLLADGRIHPARIEELATKARNEVVPGALSPCSRARRDTQPHRRDPNRDQQTIRSV